MKMRFMIEIFEAEMERDPSGGLWGRYPFEIDGEEMWIPRDQLTIQQREEMAAAMRESGEKQVREAEVLHMFARVKRAGISGVIDGSKASD